MYYLFAKARSSLFHLVVVLAIALAFWSLLPNSATQAATGTNKQISFQGKVVNSDGTNVTTGAYNFTFILYSVDSGGSPIWTETRTGGNQVTVTDGVFQVNLGSVQALPGSIDFNTDNIYLGVNFNGNGEMTPRIQFTAVPQAFNALKVAGLTVTDTTGTLTIQNAKTISFADAFTTSGAFATTLTSTGITNVTLPTGGTLLTNTAAANQTVTSTQTTGTVLGVTDSTAQTAALKGLVITMSGTGAYDQTGLEFNLSNASGTNLNDVVGTSTAWKVSKAGVASFASGTVIGSTTFSTNNIADSGSLTIKSATGANNLTLDSGSTGSVLLGTGANAKTITIGNGTDDTFSLASSAFTVSTAGALSGITTLTAVPANTTGNGFDVAANALTSGNGLALTSTATALTGNLMSLYLNPSSASTITGDILDINGGPNLTLTGNYINVTNNGSDVFKVGQAQIVSSVPQSFVAAGDVGLSYDLVFNNPSASYIKSDAPIYIESGPTWSSSDLVLRTYNSGNTVVDSHLLVSNSSIAGRALAIFDQNEPQDILTASASGVTKFTMTNAGAFIMAGGAGDPTATTGTFWYDTTANKFKIVENGVVKTICNVTDAGCGAGGSGARLDQVAAATTTSTIANANNAIVWNWGTLTTQTGLTFGGGTAMTTGSVLSVNGGTTYIHTTAETGNQVHLAFADNSTNASGNSVTAGLNVATSFNTSGAGTKDIEAINVPAPTMTGCATGACTWDGMEINTQATGALSTITQNGLNIAAAGVSAGTLNGILISSITGAGGAETAISIGAGWDTGIDMGANIITNVGNAGTDFDTSGGLTLASNLTLSAQGDIRFADADSTNWVAFQAPTTVNSNITWTLPAADAAGCLKSNGSATLSISACGDTNVQAFSNASGTWTKPANALLVIVDVWGAGGGGGGGAGGSTAAARTGGAGGGGGAYNTITMSAADLGSSAYYTAPAGGNFGNGGSSGVGGNGTAGGQTCFSDTTGTCAGNIYVTAFGGGGGAGANAAGNGGGGGGGTGAVGTGTSTATGGVGGGPGGGAANTIAGGQGGGGGATAGAGAVAGKAATQGGGGGGSSTTAGAATGGTGGSTTAKGGAGGGAGGGLVITTPVATNGGAGGQTANLTAAGGGAAGTGSGGVGGAGTSGVGFGGDGGGGGSSHAAGTGGKGGAGGIQGGGGGGGGAGSTTTGGAGGQGGHGEVVVFTMTGSGADLAEIYGSYDSSLSAGDVVAIDGSMKAGVKKTSQAYDRMTIGIVSTKPGLTIGDIEDSGATPVLVALAGRVPVKASLENGPINVGDLLTPSSVPGVAMKATKAGLIIGQSMTNLDETMPGYVVAFVKSSYGTGARLADIDGINLSADDTATIRHQKTLAYLSNQDNMNPADPNLSEIYTDRLTATMQVLSPEVIANRLITNNLELYNGQIMIKDATGSATVQLGGQESLINSHLTLGGGLTVNGSSIFIGDTLFQGKTGFEITPVFNKDTAGWAVIKVGAKEVAVRYEKEYETQPVVNVVPSKSVNYQVLDESTQGFKIVLDQLAVSDVKFAWMALLIKDAVTVESLPSLTPTPSLMLSPTEEVTSSGAIILATDSGVLSQ